MDFSFSGFGSWLEFAISLTAALVLWFYLWQVFWPRIRNYAGMEPDYEHRAEELMQSYRKRRSNGTKEQT